MSNLAQTGNFELVRATYGLDGLFRWKPPVNLDTNRIFDFGTKRALECLSRTHGRLSSAH